MPKPLNLSGRMSVMQRILSAFDEEMGIKTTSDCLSVVADPQHADVYAIRISTRECKRLDLDVETEQDYIFHPDGELEQGYFEEWPPKPRFFS